MKPRAIAEDSEEGEQVAEDDEVTNVDTRRVAVAGAEGPPADRPVRARKAAASVSYIEIEDSESEEEEEEEDSDFDLGEEED
jgi:hypothetical protein